MPRNRRAGAPQGAPPAKGGNYGRPVAPGGAPAPSLPARMELVPAPERGLTNVRTREKRGCGNENDCPRFSLVARAFPDHRRRNSSTGRFNPAPSRRQRLADSVMTISGRVSVLLLAALAAALSLESAPARAQAASEFAPLPKPPAKPKRPKPAEPAKTEAPASEPKPAAAAPAEPQTPAVTSEPAAAAAPAAAAGVKEPAASAASASPAPAEAPAPQAEKKAEEKEQPKEPAKNLAKEKAATHAKELAKEKELKEEKKKAAEKKEKQNEQAEKEPLEPKPQKADWKYAAKLPADDKGPRAIEFISKCLDNYDRCMAYVNERAEKIPAGDICLQSAADEQAITEKVRKFITLRPAMHGEAANRVVTEALYVIYPCRRAAPERTAGKKK